MIIISWKGLGWIFLVLFFVIAILSGITLDILQLEMPTYARHYFIVLCLATAVPFWFLGRKMNKEISLGYDKTGQPITLKNLHRLWNIPVQYIGIGLGVFAIMLVISILFIY